MKRYAPAVAIVGLALAGIGCSRTGLDLDDTNDGGVDADAVDAGVDAADAGPDARIGPLRFDAGLTNACEAMPGLFAYYPLDGDLLDHSGHGYDATGQVTFTPSGKIGGAARFDGETSVVHATGGAELPAQRTLCTWVAALPRPGLGQPLFSTGVQLAGDFFSLTPSVPKGGTCPFLPIGAPFIDDWGTPCYFVPSMSVPTSKWDLLCYADDGAGTITLYADGQAGTVAGEEFPSTVTNLYIGSSAIGGTTTQASLLGAMDEVSVWARALDSADMDTLWNEGRGCSLR